MIRILVLSFVLPMLCLADVQHRDGNTEVKRVPDRSERIDLVFAPEENWQLLEQDSHPDKHIELLEFGRLPDAIDAHTESAEIFVFHNSWKTDLAQAERVFHRALQQECAGMELKQWLREDLGAPRRVTVYRRPPTADCANAAIVQLLLQGADNFYSINVYLAGDELPEGLLVKWVNRLSETKACFFDHHREPCPEGIWQADVLKRARERRPQGSPTRR